jgi:hypothetical protein
MTPGENPVEEINPRCDLNTKKSESDDEERKIPCFGYAG